MRCEKSTSCSPKGKKRKAALQRPESPTATPFRISSPSHPRRISLINPNPTGKALGDIIPGLGKFTFDPNLGTVFVTSGSGVIGQRVALSLLEAGIEDVRVGIWRGDRDVGDKSLGQKAADELTARGATVVDFDWSNPDSFPEALTEVNSVFCTIPHMQGWQEVFPAFLSIAKKLKVEHFVKVSFFQSDKTNGAYQNVPFVNFHSTCDDILKLATSDSRISYTILHTTHLMSTPLIHQGPSMRTEKKFVTASYGMGVNYVSPNDGTCLLRCDILPSLEVFLLF